MGVSVLLTPIFLFFGINGVYMNKNIDLQYAIDNGIINLLNIQSIIDMIIFDYSSTSLVKNKYSVFI